jgi:hypothetical protein
MKLCKRPIRDNEQRTVWPQLEQEWAVPRQQDPVLAPRPLDKRRVVGGWIVGGIPPEHPKPAGQTSQHRIRQKTNGRTLTFSTSDEVELERIGEPPQARHQLAASLPRIERDRRVALAV